MRTWKSRLAAVGLGVVAALAVVEIGVRLWWTAVPDAVYPSIEHHAEAVPGEGGRTRQRVWGHDLYHRFRHNSLGYRGPEYGARQQGTGRVALVGDSFVYGVGVSERDAIPGQVQVLLNDRHVRAEVINGGTPGTNLEYGVARSRETMERYRPDVLVFVTLFNDFELTTTNGNVGADFDAVAARGTGEGNLVGQLAELLLPVVPTVTGQPPPVPSASIRARYALARAWRSYQLLGLYGRMLGTNWDQVERELTLLHVDSRHVRVLAWERLAAQLAELRDDARRNRTTVGVMHFMDGPLEGIPALRIREVVDQSGLPFLDLAPLWGSLSHFSRHHSFRFDSHPHPESNRRAAEALTRWMGAQGWLGTRAEADAEADTAYMEAHAARVSEYRERQARLAEEQRERLARLAEGFSTSLDARARGSAANQWLFGWREGGVGDGGRPMGSEAGVFLRAGAEPASTLQVELELRDGGVRELVVTCGDAESRLGVRTGNLTLAFPLDPAVPPSTVVECVLRAERVDDTTPGVGGSSVFVSRLSLTASP
ncbi:MAG: hypothetical protein FJ102_19680 [Deltaproteobacteria bacterium]|nr:hypothetical protein [Deltaproteobacteria bacterium]